MRSHRRLGPLLLAALAACMGLLLGTAAWAQTDAPSPSPTPTEGVTELDLTPVAPIPSADGGFFASDLALYTAVTLAFVALLLLLFFLVVPFLDRPAEKVLKRGLQLYTRGGAEETKESAGSMTASSIGRAAVGLVSSVPKPAGYEEQLQIKLDRAGWPVRASEFIALRLAAGLFGGLVGFGLLASFPLGLVLLVAGIVVPGAALNYAVNKRRNNFLGQLPDTLTLLSGALKAGYGLLQAVDTVVQESPEPTKEEFQRVLSEARLGLPLTDALDDMATRVGSEDFSWVVVAINIQSQVGGNLAELLDTIADTLREREMVRRQIAVLSAEGRLSGIILVALPFVISLYLWVINPDYIGLLTSHWFGRILIGVGIVLMGVGIWWMRKLIEIDV